MVICRYYTNTAWLIRGWPWVPWIPGPRLAPHGCWESVLHCYLTVPATVDCGCLPIVSAVEELLSSYYVSLTCLCVAVFAIASVNCIHVYIPNGQKN